MIWLMIVAVVLCFGLVLFVGAPYLPTLRAQRQQALSLLKLKPGQLLYELGCGDGAMLVEAAKTGLNVVGFELNPLLFTIAWFRTRKYRKNVQLKWGNFWRADISDADGIYVFLHTRFMSRLDRKISTQITKSCSVVSYGFAIPRRKLSKQLAALYCYRYEPLARK